MTILTLKGNTKLDEIKTGFNKAFPYLQLEFFKSDHQISEASSKKEMIKGNPEINAIRKSAHEGNVEVTPMMTVSQLEMLFRDKYGLNVQVFRKSGKVWLETSATDNMSLKGQNELGKEKSTPVEKEDLTDIDYD